MQRVQGCSLHLVPYVRPIYAQFLHIQTETCQGRRLYLLIFPKYGHGHTDVPGFIQTSSRLPFVKGLGKVPPRCNDWWWFSNSSCPGLRVNSMIVWRHGTEGIGLFRSVELGLNVRYRSCKQDHLITHTRRRKGLNITPIFTEIASLMDLFISVREYVRRGESEERSPMSYHGHKVFDCPFCYNIPDLKSNLSYERLNSWTPWGILLSLKAVHVFRSVWRLSVQNKVTLNSVSDFSMVQSSAVAIHANSPD